MTTRADDRPRALLLRAAGTNCDAETAHAFALAGATPTTLHVARVAENPAILDDFDLLAIPGGFSYGDDIAAGRILSDQLNRTLADPLRRFVDAGKPVIGICNGFQVLVQTGLLPGGDDRMCALTDNAGGGFICRWIKLKKAASHSVWLRDWGEDEEIELPIAHAEGRLVCAAGGMDWLEQHGRVALRYAGVVGDAADLPPNPNGSTNDVAALCDDSGLVLGLMPHPERYVDATQHPAWQRRRYRRQATGNAGGVAAVPKRRRPGVRPENAKPQRAQRDAKPGGRDWFQILPLEPFSLLCVSLRSLRLCVLRPYASRMANEQKSWQARIAEATDALGRDFVESVSYDWRLYKQDVAGSLAHAAMLAKVGLITEDDRAAIERGLREIEAEIDRDGPAWPGFDKQYEDIHMCVEKALIDKVGEPGRRLHTGRSRNDQVATDLMLWIYRHVEELQQRIRDLTRSFVNLAERSEAIVMPSYTHLQRAQPISAAAEAWAWATMIHNDILRVSLYQPGHVSR